VSWSELVVVVARPTALLDPDEEAFNDIAGSVEADWLSRLFFFKLIRADRRGADHLSGQPHY
jgi:hypothetical protein